MERCWRLLLVLVWFGFMIISGIQLFSNGFLLTKMVQNEKATCKRLSGSDDALTTQNVNASSDFCLEKKSKVIVIVVDALKYEFGVYNESLRDEDALPFQNKLRIFHELLENEPEKSRIMKFIADPPTTTLQRLKGLTTGTLPTFIDIGSNFASPEINEDNIIDQILAKDLNIVFMGDSTWTELFPNRFKRKHSFPSFNIYDLDTIDREIEEVLPSELNKPDWDVVIAHFLGVDHCGHRYGPLHNEMARKLSEMDMVIRKVVSQMDNDTTLFVIGDHGMTDRGDHGGESEDEINALLFAYSKGRGFYAHQDEEEKSLEMQQIDLVPVLSSILGVPVPFSNLGTVNVNLIPDKPFSDWSKYRILLQHLWHNAKQIQNYFRQYSESNINTFNAEIVDALENKFLVLSYRVNSIYTEAAFRSFEKDLRLHTRNVLKICRDVWVKFDSQNMLQGLVICVVSVFLQFLLINHLNVKQLDEVFNANTISMVYLINIGTVVFCYFGNNKIAFVSGNFNIILVACMVNVVLLAFLVVKNWLDIVDSWSSAKQMQNVFIRLLYGVLLCVFFSNSFIIEEQKIVCYVVTGLVLYHAYALQKQISRTPRLRSYSKYVTCLLIFVVIVAVVVLRMSFMYFKCREEQGNCSLFSTEAGYRVITVSKLLNKYLSLGPICDKIDVSSIASLALFVTTTRMYLQSSGSFVGYSFKVILTKFGPTVMAICIGAHFILSQNKLASVYQFQIDALAWVVYALVLVQAGVTIGSPLMVHLLKERSEISVGRAAQPSQIIPEIYNKLKGLYRSGSSSNGGSIPVVYGLPTVYSSPFLALFVFLALTISMLLGANSANGLFITIAVIFVVLILASISKYSNSSSLEQLMSPDFSTLVTWLFVVQFGFYVTSHQPTLSQIDWHAAFVGRTFKHDHSNILSGILVLMSTFNAVILLVFMFPMISIMPFVIFTKLPELKDMLQGKGKSNKTTDFKIETLTQMDEDGAKDGEFDVTRGEINLYENERTLLVSVFKLGCKLIMMQGFRVFCAMLACTIHCRHLMVWKIFAPRFIYEGVTTFIFVVMVITSYFVLTRIHKSVVRLIAKLTKYV